MTWETTYAAGVGVDANFFKNRLRLVLDYYDKYTKNVLYQVPVSGLTGVTSRWQNVGEVSNKGIELTDVGKKVIEKIDMIIDDYNLFMQDINDLKDNINHLKSSILISSGS